MDGWSRACPVRGLHRVNRHAAPHDRVIHFHETVPLAVQPAAHRPRASPSVYLEHHRATKEHSPSTGLRFLKELPVPAAQSLLPAAQSLLLAEQWLLLERGELPRGGAEVPRGALREFWPRVLTG